MNDIIKLSEQSTWYAFSDAIRSASSSIVPGQSLSQIQTRLLQLERHLAKYNDKFIDGDKKGDIDHKLFEALYTREDQFRFLPKFKALNLYYSRIVDSAGSLTITNGVSSPKTTKGKTDSKLAGIVNPNTTGITNEQAKFVELPGAKMGEVVVRFPPEASGYLHIGHAKAALLNQFYQQTFNGTLIMRFDDTNPAKENAEFEKVILKDLELLKVKPDRWTHSSDHFDILIELCEKLLNENKAYVDDTDPEIMKMEREKKINSKCRDLASTENLRRWNEMKSGTEYGQRCCVRIKIDMQSANGAMRDPTIYRCKPEPHVRTGTKYKIYPTYDFACPIVDSIEGVTHALRTTEYTDRDDQYFFILDSVKMRKPYIWAYARLNMTNTVMSKRKLTKLVDDGVVHGWDDPRMPTIRGVRRHGLTVEGLKEFIVAQGGSRTVVTMEWDKLWAFNKKVLEPIAPRYTALQMNKSLVACAIEGVNKEIKTEEVPLVPKDHSLGMKKVQYGPNVWIEQNDAEQLNQGDIVTFINWGNMKVGHVKKDKDGLIISINLQADLENKDYKKTLKVTWIVNDASCPLYRINLVDYDYIITKPVLTKDDNWSDFVNPSSEHRFELIGEPAMSQIKQGDIVQFQRLGYRICDAVPIKSSFTGRELPAEFIVVPDGSVKSSISAQSTATQKAVKGQKPTAVVPPQVSSDAILLEIKEIGDKVRDLKASKAQKEVISAEIEKLLFAKKKFKEVTGKDWNPKLVDQIHTSILEQPATQPNTSEISDSGCAILLEINKIGDEVRQLKGQKADKPLIEAEVAKLLDAKKRFKELTGKDWTPKLIDQIKQPTSSCVVAQPVTNEKATTSDKQDIDALLHQINSIDEHIQLLKAEKSDEKLIKAQMSNLLAKKNEFRALTSKNWDPKLHTVARDNPDILDIVSTSEVSIDPEDYLSTAELMLLDIKKVGDKIRQMKEDKFDKKAIAEQVEILKEGKAGYKELTGNDWTPNLIEPVLNIINQRNLQCASKSECAPSHSTPDIAVKLSQNFDVDVPLLLRQIVAINDGIAVLLKRQIPSFYVEQEKQKLDRFKNMYASATGKSWSDELLSKTMTIDSTQIILDKSKAEESTKKHKQKKDKQPKQINKEQAHDAGKKKETRLGLEAKKSENFSEWYSQVITKAEMIEYYDVSGCYVLRPLSYSIWERIQNFFDQEIKKLGVENCYFPMFVSHAALEREKTHIADFAPEVAWVTKSGESDMAEPVAIRPTSETVMYPSYARWVQSHRDLPIKLNQWCNVVRWEFKHPTPFLRTREFLWQEGHTAYANKEEAITEVYQILDLYAQVYEDYLAVPVIKGKKTNKEKFAGGDFTTTVEAYIPQSGRGIQGATSHHLGQNFSKMFNITFEDPDNGGKEFAYQNSWGITTRTIGVATMIHSDDKGLVLPPKIAQLQVIIIACGITASLDDTKKKALLDRCNLLKTELNTASVRTQTDLRDNYSPGWKFNHWELKGVPIRCEIGPRDFDAGQAVLVRRDTGEKSTVKINQSDTPTHFIQLLTVIQNALFTKAKMEMDEHVKIVEEWEEFSTALEMKCLIMAPFCETDDCEDKVKQDSAREEATEPGAPAMGAKSLCIPFDQPKKLCPDQKCVKCGKEAKSYTLFGRSY